MLYLYESLYKDKKVFHKFEIELNFQILGNSGCQSIWNYRLTS